MYIIQSALHRWMPGSDWTEFDKVLCPLVDNEAGEGDLVQVIVALSDINQSPTWWTTKVGRATWFR